MKWLLILATMSCALIGPQPKQEAPAAPPDPRKWYNDQKSPLEFAQDKYACQVEIQPYWFRNEFDMALVAWRMCMEAHGWGLR